ncbi:MAG TPA: periplasmic heavy metal sensor [Nitrospirota bacterium]|nr:periplasmic heavy metal sensor [Nitrospirota bacterium]
MVKNKLTIASTFLLLSAFVLTACYRTPEQRAEHIVNHMSKDLDLNAAQHATLEKIKDEFLARRPQIVKQREEAIREANALMRSKEIDTVRLNALVEKSKIQADDMIAFIADKFVEIHAMLTPEQREKLVAHIEKYTHRGGEKERQTKDASPGGSS